MPRKTLLGVTLEVGGVSSFNEAAARCRGKPRSGRPARSRALLLQ